MRQKIMNFFKAEHTLNYQKHDLVMVVGTLILTLTLSWVGAIIGFTAWVALDYFLDPDK